MITYDERGCRKVLHTYAHRADEIKTEVEHTIRAQIVHDFSRTKTASHIPYHGMKLFECRVNVGKLPAIRVAFALSGDDVDVAFMTTNIQKSDFSRQLDAFLK